MFQLTLVEEFALEVDSHRLVVPHMAERVLTYLALVGRPVARCRLAGTLWPECSELAASKSLRTALWRLRQVEESLVETDRDRLRLDPNVAVDFADLVGLAYALVDDPRSAELAHVHLLINHAELLPDWDEEWVVADRERYRLVRLTALESAAEALLTIGQLGGARVAAAAVVRAEPLRESARRILMQIHLAQGNSVEAIHEYRRFRDLLRDEIGMDPSPCIERLLPKTRSN
ncbi:BTAD domain-containing putative transcriptional regulator [Nocardia sp. XZ_19_231]|uniref:AfsR/SARP family transcriptional regulator n=1 Tax=Nocardia sp. XZ_19_231 TaxID=2769252 RepID=UPI00188E144F|nr:BTAD domain-containing putative transcriptional regulator [Nocardia sp. XZ_19_231]